MSCVKIELLRTTSREWRWQMTARNGERIGSSTEFYRRRIDAIRNLTVVTGFVVPNLGPRRLGRYCWTVMHVRRSQFVVD